MKWLITASIAVAYLALATNPAAQEERTGISEHQREFQDFFRTLTTSGWTYHTRMTGPDGKTQFEGEDFRTYRFGVRGRFVIEDVYHVNEDGECTHAGIQLVGVDADTGQLNISQFWSWQPTILGDVGARLVDDGSGTRRLTGIARPAGLPHPTLSFECAFQNDDLLRCVTDTETEDGVRFRSNVETFSRRASAACL